MTIAVATIALLLATASLALTLSLGRRLRTAEERLRQVADPLGQDLPEVGTRVPSFTAVTTDAEPVTDADLAGEEVLVGFLSASCESCRWDLPKLVTVLTDVARRGPRPVVVLAGDPERRGEIRGELAAVTRLIEDDEASTLTKSFGIRGFPSLLRVADGTVVSAGHTVGELALAAP
jgi:thiol-disulfide isomerase/thioredoxin